MNGRDIRIAQQVGRWWLPLLVAAGLAGAMAQREAIGFVAGSGALRVDQAPVTGNGTLYDGSVIETIRSASNIRLRDGTYVRMASRSRGIVYRDRLVLENGTSWFESGPAYRIETASLRVSALEAKSTGWLTREAGGRVRVAALSGSISIANGEGLLLARVSSGRLLELSPQPSGAMPSTLTGTITRRDGAYFLRDEVTGITVELRGTGLEAQVGRRVEVSGKLVAGAKPRAGADHVFEAATVTRAAAKAAGMSAATKAAIAGLAIGGAAIGTTLAVTGGEDEEPPAVSR